MVSLYQNMKLHFTLVVFKLLNSNCNFLSLLLELTKVLKDSLSSLRNDFLTVHTFDQLIQRTANNHNLVNIVLLFVYKLRYPVNGAMSSVGITGQV